MDSCFLTPLRIDLGDRVLVSDLGEFGWVDQIVYPVDEPESAILIIRLDSGRWASAPIESVEHDDYPRVH